MNDNAKSWVAALRSGKYEQAKNVLKSATGYCCLGVACELALAAGVTELVAEGDHFFYGKNSRFCGTLPPEVQRWLGLRTGAGNFGGPVSTSLSSLNDSGSTFLQIADTIESEPTDLFGESILYSWNKE